LSNIRESVKFSIFAHQTNIKTVLIIYSMKSFLTIIIFCTALIVLTGCPSETNVSIDDGSWEYPDWVYGKWKIREGSKEVSEYNTYVVKEVEGKLGNVIAYPVDSFGHEKTTGLKRIIFSRVGPQIFVNVCAEGDEVMSDPGYYIYFFNEIAPYEVELIGVKEKKIPFGIDRPNLQAWLLSNMNDKSIYDYENLSAFMKEN